MFAKTIKKPIIIFLITIFLTLFTSACDNEQSQILFNKYPFSTETLNSTSNIFKTNDRIYYLVTLPKPVTTKKLYIQIVKTGGKTIAGDSADRLGYDLVWTKRVKLKDIKQAVPAQIAEKWLSVNNSLLEYTLAKRYGLNKTQINQYKNAYNSYAIEEYKVINDQKGLPTSERADKLREANDIFCERVRPLFKTSSYKKWKGKRVYDFEQRVEQKTGK